MKKVLKELIPYIVIILVVVVVRTFIVTPVRVQGDSMVPTLQDKDILLLKKYDRSYDRFDIVILNYNGSKLVKRIIGLPGESISYQDSELYVDGEKIEENFLPEGLDFHDFDTILLESSTVPQGYYFVVGDNRNNSTDSRLIGYIREEDILGTATFRIFPFTKIGTVK